MTIPIHLHQRVPIQMNPSQVAARLRSAPSAYSAAATADALDAVADLARAGGFRARALPTVQARAPSDTEFGSMVVVWSGDEDATGWPAMTLWVVATPAGDGWSDLVILSPRHPGYDLSTNRVDKVWRDRLARTAVRAFAISLRRLLESGVEPPEHPADAALAASAHRAPTTDSVVERTS